MNGAPALLCRYGPLVRVFAGVPRRRFGVLLACLEPTLETGMGFLRQGGLGRGCGWLGAVALVGFCLGGVGSAAVRKAVKVSPWDAAVAARERFEAEPARGRIRRLSTRR